MTIPEEFGAPAPSVGERVRRVIEELRPYIQRDGGDIELVEVDAGGQVRVRLWGACVGCPMAQMTLTMGVERRLRQQVPEVTQVILVPPGPEPVGLGPEPGGLGPEPVGRGPEPGGLGPE